VAGKISAISFRRAAHWYQSLSRGFWLAVAGSRQDYPLRMTGCVVRLEFEQGSPMDARHGARALGWELEMSEGSTMDQHQEQARKAESAVSAVSEAMAKTLTEMRPSFAVEYDLDDQLLTLAIAKAAVGLAADAASEATGMGTDEHAELEGRLQEVVFDAMTELLNK
jgi:hypothetical protein